MSITNVALGSQAGQAPGSPVYKDIVTLDLDASYPQYGYPDFNATVAGVIGAGKTILSVEQNNFPGNVIAKYDRTNDKLVIFEVAAGPTISEVGNGVSLATITGLELVITSK
jgi:hypothetical protein